MFFPASLVIPLLVMLPNIVFFRFPPVNPPKEEQGGAAWLKGAEGLGQMGSCAAPLFAPVTVDGAAEWSALAGMVLALALYYLGWIRYYRGGREYKLLLKPMGRVPVPMAIFPVCYFLLAAVVLHSPYMLASSLLLGAGHIPLSCRSSKMVKM